MSQISVFLPCQAVSVSNPWHQDSASPDSQIRGSNSPLAFPLQSAEMQAFLCPLRLRPHALGRGQGVLSVHTVLSMRGGQWGYQDSTDREFSNLLFRHITERRCRCRKSGAEPDRLLDAQTREPIRQAGTKILYYSPPVGSPEPVRSIADRRGQATAKNSVHTVRPATGWSALFPASPANHRPPRNCLLIHRWTSVHCTSSVLHLSTSNFTGNGADHSRTTFLYRRRTIVRLTKFRADKSYVQEFKRYTG